MRTLYELYEAQRKYVAEKRKEEYRFAPCYYCCSPKSGKTDCALRVVEKAIDTAVSQLGSLVKEKVAKKPSKLSEPAAVI